MFSLVVNRFSSNFTKRALIVTNSSRTFGIGRDIKLHLHLFAILDLCFWQLLVLQQKYLFLNENETKIDSGSRASTWFLFCGFHSFWGLAAHVWLKYDI